MKLSELKSLIKHIESTRDNDDLELMIKIFRVGSLGPTPSVGINSINVGFDWNLGRLIIIPEKQLREIDIDECAQIRDKYKGLGIERYKLQELEAENKKFRKEIKELKNGKI